MERNRFAPQRKCFSNQFVLVFSLFFMNDILLIVSGDLQFRSEIQLSARQESVECYFVSYGDHLSELVKRTNPFLLVADFAAQGTEWIMKHLSEIKVMRSQFPIVGIISEALEADVIRLERAGCDHVLTREQFFRKFSSIVTKYLR